MGLFSKPKGPKETAQMRALADIGVKWAQFDREHFRPAVKQMITKFRQPGATERLTGQAGAQFEKAFSDTTRQTGASRVAAGGGAGLRGALSDTLADKAIGKSLGMSDVAQASEDLRAQTRQGLVDIGTGKAGDALEGMGRSALVGQQQAIEDARASAMSRSARNQGLAAIGGAAAAGYMGGGLTPGDQTQLGSPAIVTRRPAGAGRDTLVMSDGSQLTGSQYDLDRIVAGR